MTTTEVKVPDIGDFSDVPIIEIHVGKGDTLAVDDPVVTLESDKATMDIPSPADGEVQELMVNVGDRVSEGTVLLTVATDQAETEPPTLLDQQEPATEEASEPTEAARAPAEASVASAGGTADIPAVSPTDAVAAPAGAGAEAPDFAGVHAGPSVRRLARELDVDLTQISGTGEKGRITKEDVKSFLRGAPAGAGAAARGGAGIPEVPAQDFSKFGPIETQPLSRIRKLSGPFLHRSWLNVPHVTHNDEADVTDVDAFRKELDDEAKPQGYRVTLLAFIMKAAVAALKAHPEVNSSLSPDQASLIVKGYYHLGVAVDTPEGLVVPVIRDVDTKGITELSQDLGAMSAKARDGKLTPTDISGASFTISSLGGIGGTSFTPIVNAPEVAILGVSRSKMTPVWDGGQFVPRLLLPLSLSYDHRVIDGALAARFTRDVAKVLGDVRRLLV
jgi:pyruvate dehydrogenase E2 component (dihydrolipoamide acetyltransferase)